MKKQNELISVIVPVYKVEKYINRCVDSILAQTYKNLEVILVDDGSPDSCPTICDEYAKKDNRVRVVHKKNEGVSVARNAGLEISKGNYVAFVDSDDFIESTMYEKLYVSITSNNSEIAMCGYNFAYENNEKKIMNEYILNCEYYRLDTVPDVMFVDNSFGCIWRFLYRKDILENHRFSREFFSGEDLLFNLNIVSKDTKISIVKECLYNYYQRRESIVHSYTLAKVDQRINMAKKALELIEPLVSEDCYKEYSFRLYEMCVLDCILAPNYRSLLRYIKNDEYLKFLKTKENYKIRIKNRKNVIKNVSIRLIYHNCFVLLRLLYKLKRAI